MLCVAAAAAARWAGPLCWANWVSIGNCARSSSVWPPRRASMAVAVSIGNQPRGMGRFPMETERGPGGARAASGVVVVWACVLRRLQSAPAHFGRHSFHRKPCSAGGLGAAVSDGNCVGTFGPKAASGVWLRVGIPPGQRVVLLAWCAGVKSGQFPSETLLCPGGGSSSAPGGGRCPRSTSPSVSIGNCTPVPWPVSVVSDGNRSLVVSDEAISCCCCWLVLLGRCRRIVAQGTFAMGVRWKITQ